MGRDSIIQEGLRTNPNGTSSVKPLSRDCAATERSRTRTSLTGEARRGVPPPRRSEPLQAHYASTHHQATRRGLSSAHTVLRHAVHAVQHSMYTKTNLPTCQPGPRNSARPTTEQDKGTRQPLEAHDPCSCIGSLLLVVYASNLGQAGTQSRDPNRSVVSHPQTRPCLTKLGHHGMATAQTACLAPESRQSPTGSPRTRLSSPPLPPRCRATGWLATPHLVPNQQGREANSILVW